MLDKIKMNAFNALPTVYTESLSYYETLCKAVNAVNECIDLVNSLNLDSAGYIKLTDKEEAPTGADIYKDIDGKIHIVNSLITEQGVDVNNRQIRNVRTPVNGTDATNKDYVDDAVASGGRIPENVSVDLTVNDNGNYYNPTITSAIFYPTSNMIVVKGRGAFIGSPSNSNYINVTSTYLIGNYSIVYGVLQSENSGMPNGTIIGNGVVTTIDPPGVDLYNLTNTTVGSAGSSAEFTLILFVTEV